MTIPSIGTVDNFEGDSECANGLEGVTVESGVIEFVEETMAVDANVLVEELGVVDNCCGLGGEADVNFAGSTAVLGYCTVRFCGGGAWKVSLVGLEQSGVPSDLVEQQRHSWST